jgi:AraC family transcriptional regulator
MPTSSRIGRIGRHDANDLRVGSVTLARRVYGPTDGVDVEFPGLVAMVSHGPSCEVRWRAAEGDALRATVVAAGQAIVGRGQPSIIIKCKVTISVFAFGMDEAFVARIHQDAFGGTGEWTVERRIGINDAIIERFCTLGQEELDKGGTRGRLYAEALGTALTVHLLGNYGSARGVARVPRGGLLPGQLRRVIDYMDAHLCEDLSLAELADVAGFSRHYFARSFRLATGMPPHQYVIERRVERACRLLLDTSISIGVVAASLGFASQSHLTEHFRRVTGLTPARYRQSHG